MYNSHMIHFPHARYTCMHTTKNARKYVSFSILQQGGNPEFYEVTAQLNSTPMQHHSPRAVTMLLSSRRKLMRAEKTPPVEHGGRTVLHQPRRDPHEQPPSSLLGQDGPPGAQKRRRAPQQSRGWPPCAQLHARFDAVCRHAQHHGRSTSHGTWTLKISMAQPEHRTTFGPLSYLLAFLC